MKRWTVQRSIDSGMRQTVSPNGETVYWPKGRPRGGIVCLHGSEGGWAGWNDLSCALFAAHGFAALSRDYSQAVRWPLPPDIDDVPLEGTVAALDAMRAEMAPFGCGVGLFGASRGAEHALLLAQLLSEDGAELPDAVAVHCPPDAAWPAFIAADFRTGRPWAGDRSRPAWLWSGRHDRTRPGTPLCSGSMPIPVFVAYGTEDMVWDADMARRLVTRLIGNGGAPEAHVFEGEGHSFRPPARTREWASMATFFTEHLTKAT